MKLKFPYVAPFFLLACLGGTFWWVLSDHSDHYLEDPVALEEATRSPLSHGSIYMARPDEESQVATPKRYTRMPRANTRLDDLVMSASGSVAKAQFEANRSVNGVGQIISIGNDSLDVKQRVKLLEGNISMNQEEIGELMNFVRSRDVPENMRASSYHWLVDEMFQASRRNTRDPKGLSRELAEIASNVAVDLVIRDYAIQHLGHLYHEGGDVKLITKTLMAGIDEKQGTVAGTSLLAIKNIGETEQLHISANKVATNPDYSSPSRLTAFQLLSDAGTGKLNLAVKASNKEILTKQHFKLISESNSKLKK